MRALPWVAAGPSTDLDVAILATFEFEMRDGTRQTAVFGLLGRYSLG